MPTQLALDTELSVPSGQSVDFGDVDVRAYERIRVIAFSRVNSAADAVVRLTILSAKNSLLATLDEVNLPPQVKYQSLVRFARNPAARLSYCRQCR
jgi:hypothetical protein